MLGAETKLKGNILLSEYIPRKLPFEKQNFDLIFAFSVFTHLSEKVTKIALDTLSNSLTEEGLLVITIRPIEYWNLKHNLDKGFSKEEMDACMQSHSDRGFAFYPHLREKLEGEVTYGDTSISIEYIKENFKNLNIVRIECSNIDPYQIILFLKKVQTTQLKTLLEEVYVMAAMKFSVIPTVHPEDLIFQFCLNHECFKSKEDAIHYYFMQANESAKKLSLLIDKYFTHTDNVELLEFASGYGAVTRHFKNTLPNVNITASDIHPEAVTFIRETLKTNAELSCDIPEDFQLSKMFDIVFALSFFSHMPKTTWTRWLKALIRNTKEHGLIIFTTHGEISRKNFNNPRVDSEGFWFKPISEQTDLDVETYGMTVTLKEFVYQEVNKIDNVELLHYEEAFWWGHQDVYVLKKL